MKKYTFILMLTSFLASLPAFATTLFHDDFSGGAVTLHGTTPDITTGGATWVSATNFRANGNHAQRGSATLAFTPVDGFVYSAETWISASTGTFYIGMGFADGSSTGTAPSQTFGSGGAPDGRVWMQYQLPNTDAGADTNTGTNNAVVSGVSSAAWTSFEDKKGGSIGLRIDLDTTPGPGNWTATFYAKESLLDNWTLVRPTVGVGNINITSVGLTSFRTNAFTTQSFTVTAIPEPSSIALMLVGLMGGVFAYRRRK